MNDSPTAAAKRTRGFMLVAMAITVVLYGVPYGQTIGYPLLLLSTLAHEMVHGLTAVITGGTFYSLEIYADASGMATHGTSGRLAQGAVAAGGLLGPAVAAAVLFVLSPRPKVARFALFGVGLLLVASCVVVVRNFFGFLFVLLVAAVALAIAAKAPPRIAQITLVFVGMQLALAVFSRGDYLFTDVAMTADGPRPSDVAQMADLLLLPYWFWGGVCGLFSVAVLGMGLWIFWRATSTNASRA